MEISVIVAVSKIEARKRSLQSEKGHDKEKFWMVVERVANEIEMASVSCVKWRSQLAGPLETTYFSMAK